MCGIAGYFGPAELPAERVEATLAIMGRRGPDGSASIRYQARGGRNLCLLHARLAIIDLDPRSDQPFRQGATCIVFNGELYNYVEVGKGLEAKGFRPRTASDTEVFAALLEREGPAGLDRAEGMWAFAEWDTRDDTLTLGRDRFGEKPLFVYRDAEGGLLFGSEAKFIASLLGRRLEPDLEHLRRYLVNGYKALYKVAPGGARHTFFKGLGEVEAGHVLRIDAHGREASQRYWTPRTVVDETMTYAQAVEGTRERLRRAMEIRLRSDVPLAFCMSGGVDSNALIALARRALRYDVHGFTIASADARYDERDLVEASVRELGIKHTVVPTETRDFLPRLRTLVRQHDAPVYTITYYAHWLLMRAVHEHGYKVALSGTAADELFSGYYDHHLAYLHEVRGDPDRHREALAAWSAHVKPTVRNPFLSDPDLFVRDPAFRGHIYLGAEDFAAYLTTPFHEEFTEERFVPDLLRNRMLNEMFHEAVPVILHEDDLNAMYYGIENRSPFLDRPLFEFAFSIPTRHLVRDGYAKAVLRDALRGIAPDAVLDSRRKVGFNASIHDFLDVRSPSVRAEVLGDGPIWAHVRRDRVERLLERDFLPNSESKFLFYFLCAKLFLEELGG